MNPAILGDVPHELLTRLHGQGDRPSVPQAEREAALGWLRGVLVDFTLLTKHISALQKLYGAPFRHPRARRDGVPEGSTPEAHFRYRDVWPEGRILAVLENGAGGLGDGELGELLLNPYALSDLHDAIGEVCPGAWMPVMLDVGRDAMRRESPQATKAPAKVGLSSLPPAATPGESPTARKAEPSPWRWAASSALATAAVLLISFGAVWMQFGPRRDGGIIEPELFASATPTYGKRGGARDVLTGLDVKGTAGGHITVVLLEADAKQFVLPRPGTRQSWRLGKEGEAHLVLPEGAEGATLGLLVVTETPAAAEVRSFLDDRRYTLGQADDLEKYLAAQLAEAGFKRGVIDRVKLTPPKRP